MIDLLLKVERILTLMTTAFALFFGAILIGFFEKELNLDGFGWFFSMVSFSYGALLVRFVIETRYKP